MDKLSRFITRLLSLTIILLVLIVVSLRLGLSNIEFFKAEIEALLARDVAPGLRFSGIQGGWNHLNPILRLSDASITLSDHNQTTAISNMSVEFDIWKSLLIKSAVVREVSSTVSKLSLRKDNTQQWWLNEFSLGGPDQGESEYTIEQLISQIPHYLHLEVNQLIVFDQSNGEKYQIDNIEIDAQHREGAYYLQLNANLPDVLGNKLAIKSIIGEENSVAYLKSDRLELDHLASLFGINIGRVTQAELGGEIWINFLNHKTLAINGNISINQGLFQIEEGGELLPFTLASRISAYRAEQQWDISNRVESLSINFLPLRGFESELRVIMDAGRAKTVEGWVDEFELYNLQALDERLLPAEIADSLKKSELRGQLRNIWFSLDPHNIKQMQLMAEATNLSSQPVIGIPGVNRIEGDLVFGNQNAALDLGSSQMSLDFADQFRAPLEIDRFKLKADVSLIESGILLSVPVFEAVNNDIKAFGRLWLEADKAEKPFLYLRANFEDGDGSSTAKYLPVKIMPKKVVSWVDAAIKAVDVSDGNLLYHGRLQNIQSLAQNRSGEMMVDFAIDNSEVMFDSNWASARNGSGRVQFHNMGMEVDLDKVAFDSIDDASAKIRIADFKNTLVEVGVTTNTLPNTALQTWIATPVGKKYSSVVKKFTEAEGSVLANIAISVPVGAKKESAKVDVRLKFDDAAVKAADWGLEFSHIDGELRITEKSITGKDIKALYYQDPVIVDVGTDQKDNETVISATGRIDSQNLLNLLPEYLTRGISGSSPWKIRVGISNTKSDSAKPIVKINAESTLENTTVEFPEPFKKSASASRRATTEVSIFQNDSINFEVNYGSDIKAKGKLKPDADRAYGLEVLGLGLSTPIRPFSSEGIKVYGSLENLPLDEWIQYYQSQGDSDDSSSAKGISLVDTIDVDIKTTLFHGRAFTDTGLVMIRTADGFTGTIESSLLKGNFSLPLKQSPQNPIIADLEYLKIQSSDSESKPTGMLPQNFFNLRLLSKVMSYGDYLVTDFLVDTRVGENQLKLDTLAFRRDKVLLTANANWQYLAEINQHRTNLNLSVTGKELGQTLAALGFGNTMHNGTINMDGKIKWSGELLHLDWESLAGDARLEITDGVLKDVEPGKGRFVGLLSLSALPRRLALDFSDVLFNGMDFDKISGTYQIKGENLYTSDTKMDGVSADVKIYGKIGLRERNYDQTLLVTPNIRHALPVLGSLLSSNAVGWGLLLLQNLFKKSIDKSVEIEYKVTGPWENPKVDLVEKVIVEKKRPTVRERNEK